MAILSTWQRELLKSLWSRLPRPKFATGGLIDENDFPMPTKLHVEGAGLISLPLSQHHLKAALGKTKSSGISFPGIPDFLTKVVPGLAGRALGELGIDATALKLSVESYKLHLYERGDRMIKFQKDVSNNNDPGMFAKMFIQLPTMSGHEGGELEVRHAKKSMTFNVPGFREYSHTLFFCDCEYKVNEVTSGSKLLLELNLFRNNHSRIMNASSVSDYISSLGRVQALLKEWAEDVKNTPHELLVVPLSYDCRRKSNVTIAGLQGHDRVVAALLSSCSGFLHVHHCMIDVDIPILDKLKTMDDEKAKNLETIYSVTESQILCPFNAVCYDPKFFNKDSDEESDKEDSYYLNSKCPALVVWPKTAFGSLFFFKSEVEWFEKQHQLEPETLDHYLSDGGPSRALDILESCLKHGYDEAAVFILKKWGMELAKLKSKPKVMVAALQKYGWESCEQQVIEEGILKKFEAEDGVHNQWMVQQVKAFGTSGWQRVDVFWKTAQGLSRNVKGRRSFLRNAAEFAVELELAGLREYGLDFVKGYIKATDVVEVYKRKRDGLDHKDVLVLLLTLDEKCYPMVTTSKLVDIGSLREVVECMSKAAGLIGLNKENEKLTQLFSELASRSIKERCYLETETVGAVLRLANADTVKLMAEDSVRSYARDVRGLSIDVSRRFYEARMEYLGDKVAEAIDPRTERVRCEEEFQKLHQLMNE